MFTRVLFPIDLHEQSFSLDALKFAVNQAQNARAELYLLTVLPHLDKPTMLDFQHDQDTLREIEESARERLDRLVSEQVPAEIETTGIVQKGGSPHSEILRHAKDKAIDLIVIPSHDKSALEEFFMGSCAAKVVRGAQCSVMVYRKPKSSPGHDPGGN